LMRKIGLLGGPSSEGTALYYERINALVRSRLGGHNSSDLVVSSPNFEPLVELRQTGAFDRIGSILAENAEWLMRAGAEVIVICADPMHGAFAAVAARIGQLNAQLGAGARLIDGTLETMQALKAYGFDRPLVLSMQNDLEQEAYVDRMREGGVAVMVPSLQDRDALTHVLLNELCVGQVRRASRDRLLSVIDLGIARGADCVVFACSEISLMLDPSDLPCPGFDSAVLQAEAAVEVSLDLHSGSTRDGAMMRLGGGLLR